MTNATETKDYAVEILLQRLAWTSGQIRWLDGELARIEKERAETTDGREGWLKEARDVERALIRLGAPEEQIQNARKGPTHHCAPESVRGPA